MVVVVPVNADCLKTPNINKKYRKQRYKRGERSISRHPYTENCDSDNDGHHSIEEYSLEKGRKINSGLEQRRKRWASGAAASYGPPVLGSSLILLFEENGASSTVALVAEPGSEKMTVLDKSTAVTPATSKSVKIRVNCAQCFFALLKLALEFLEQPRHSDLVLEPVLNVEE
jgi:hypothetical protein